MKSVSRFLLSLSWLLAGCASDKNSPPSLPKLLVQRLDWMDEVAAAKQARSLPIFDPAREAELLGAVTQRGVAAGLKAENVRRFFTGQMQAAKGVQEEWLRQHPGAASSLQPVPDLAQTVRPALDKIGREMIAELAHSHSPAESAALLNEARQRLAHAGYSEAVMRPALEGLQAGLLDHEVPSKP